MSRLGHWRVLLLAIAAIVTFPAVAAKADDCNMPGATAGRSAASLDCPAPKKGEPARACYAAALIEGKLPAGRPAGQRRCLPLKDYADADILVLGEVHDNWVHHALRAEMIARFADAKRGRTAVVMEHIRTDKSAALAAYQAGIDRTRPRFWKAAAAGLGRALDWSKSGWPAWHHFQPIAEAAFKAGAPIYAGDVTRAEIRNVARKGLSALATDQRARLALEKPLSPGLRNALLTELEASHCGLMPKAAFGTMADAQRLRDAALADAAIEAARRHGSAILLTGNGHARTDRGAPAYVRRRVPDIKVIAVAFMEGETGTPNPPLRLLPKAPDNRPSADALVVTGRVDRPDPCEKMRQRFKKRRQ